MSTLFALQGVFQAPVTSAAAWGFASSFALCALLVLTQRWHGALTLDCSHGVQKCHTDPTPRVGGIPIVLGLMVARAHAPADIQNMLTPIVIAAMPAFLFGVAEDMTKRVGVLTRLLATMASGLLAWWLTDASLTRVDVWAADILLKFTVFSVIFTSFAVGGVANAINIIDGLNGLASSMSTLAFVGYAWMAWQVGDPTLAGVSLVLGACVWGFFWVNWPFGKIFLGDGGSYFVGFALAWVAVMMIERHPSVSAFAVLLVCAHPVVEVLFSIFRRRIKKRSPGQPDRLHFHSLLRQRYVRRWFSGQPRAMHNSIAGMLAGSLTLPAMVLANLTHHNVGLSFISVVGVSLLYLTVYARMVRFGWCSPIEFLVIKPVRMGVHR